MRTGFDLAIFLLTLALASTSLGAGQAESAYGLLKPLETDRAGEPDFDFALGRAAIDSGRIAEAIFALQRVVDTQPENSPARAELWRALMLANETDARNASQGSQASGSAIQTLWRLGLCFSERIQQVFASRARAHRCCPMLTRPLRSLCSHHQQPMIDR